MSSSTNFDGKCSRFGVSHRTLPPVLQECTGQAECVCTTHPCIDAAGNHTNTECNDGDDDDLHICYENYDATNSRCVLQCLCASGYVENSAGDDCDGMSVRAEAS